MAQADVLSLIDAIGHLDDTSTRLRFYQDAVFDLGRRGWLTGDDSAQRLTSGTATYTPASGDAIDILGVLYGDRMLPEVNVTELIIHDRDWRDRRGDPVAYTFEDETTNTFRLYPTPEFVPASQGATVDPNRLWIFLTETRANVPAWLEWPLVFDVLQRDLAYPSAHQDLAFSERAGRLAELFYRMVGEVPQR